MAMTIERHVVLGTGPLGMATAAALLRRGHQVQMVNRSGRAPAPAGAVIAQADLYDPAQVRQVAAGATAVYQCAQPGYAAWTTAFPPLQTSIINGVAAAGAKLIVAENLYMYGAVDGPIHEDLPYAAHTRKGRVRARMAEEVAAAHQSGKLRTTAARGSDFFGPGVRASTLGDRVFGPAVQGQTAQFTGHMDVPHSYTFIDDFGEALAILGERDEALGAHWHVPNAPALTQRELAALIEPEVGQPVRFSSVGRLMLTLGGLFIPEARETVEMLYEFNRPFVVDGSRFAQTFTFQPTPLPAAIRRTIEWYRLPHAVRAAPHHV
jgi:nucleoside-diphosphate-sugar epimerase